MTIAELDEAALVTALRSGDEQAFTRVVDLYHGSLVRMAMTYVPSRAVAEEVAQETWLGVIKGIDRFEGRSSLRTWIFRILTNIAKKRGVREHRSVPFSSLVRDEVDSDEAAVDADRFVPPDGGRWAGHWSASPVSIARLPEEALLSREAREIVQEAIDGLPEAQRKVLTLRDVEGFDSAETCAILELSEGNQRVLLHRARAKVQQALEAYLGRQEVA